MMPYSSTSCSPGWEPCRRGFRPPVSAQWPGAPRHKVFPCVRAASPVLYGTQFFTGIITEILLTLQPLILLLNRPGRLSERFWHQICMPIVPDTRMHAPSHAARIFTTR